MTVPPPYIALTFVALALVTLGGTLVWAIVGTPVPLALLHAIVVGVFLTVAMGLLYQFVPVVSMSGIKFPMIPFVHAAIAACGTLCLVIGFQHGAFETVFLGGILHAAGIVLELIVLTTTALAGEPPAPIYGTFLALLWLVAAIATGGWMAHLIAGGSLPIALARDHAAFGLIGFFATLIYAISFRLLRMFERTNQDPSVPVFGIASSLACAALAFALPLGAYLSAAAAALFGFQIGRVGVERSPAYQPETFAYVVVSTIAAIGAALLLIFAQGMLAIITAVWLFIGTAVIGYLQRIVPFIWWMVRSRRERVRTIPTLAEMNHSLLGYGILVAWVLAGFAWLGSTQSHVAPALALIAFGGLLLQLSRPFVLPNHT